MIDILSLNGGRPNYGPISVGEARVFRLEGDGPFKVSSRCFVDKPRPPGPGFVSCPECETRTIEAGSTFSIIASIGRWARMSGQISVKVDNDFGESAEFRLTIEANISGGTDGSSLTMS